ALMYILRAKQLNDKTKNADWSARIYYGIGYSYLLKQKDSSALQYFNQAVSFAKKSSNSNILSKSYNQIGLIYSNKNDFKKSLTHYHQSLNISENKEELSDNTLAVLSNIANLYILQ